MRQALKKINDERIKVVATVDRFGSKTNYKGQPEKTVCFKDLRDTTDKVLTDHLWFTVRKTIDRLQLQEGDRVEFEARVKLYIKDIIKTQ